MILNSVLVLVQGWSCFSPTFDAVSFVSLYIELPVFALMFVIWKLIKRTKFKKASEMDLVTDTFYAEEKEEVAHGIWPKTKRALVWLF